VNLPAAATTVEGVTSAVDRADLRARVEKALATFLGQQRTVLAAIDPGLAEVADAIDSFVLGGGKRLRPAFAFWGHRGAGGEDTPEVVGAVASLEFLQASALVHDDVMDDSDTRRGEPAVHRRFAATHIEHGWQSDPDRFGAGSAILLGDLCLAWSDEMLRISGLDAPALLRAHVVFDLMRTELIAGQYLDLHAQATGDTSIRRATTVARYKSAKYTVERPLMMGGAIADAPTEIQRAYSAYGLPIGEAFQLRDDILGVFGDPSRTGKPAGDDLRSGKRTYLVASALDSADRASAAEVSRYLGDPDLDDAAVARLRDIITATGALRRTEERIDELVDAALAALDQVTLANHADTVLIGLAEAATRRAE
jgi:geranylgeranyl diphosphate synthase type I